MDAAADTASSILLVFAHPAFERSVIGRALLERALADGRIRSRDLYQLYPDFAVDIRREQKQLLAHDVVLLQFPLLWYGVPALLKEWIDATWLSGVAYGSGARFAGKTLACVVSTGQGAETYATGGSIEQLLLPLRRTAEFCAMRWGPPFVVHGTLADDDIERYGRFLADLAPAGTGAAPSAEPPVSRPATPSR